LAVGAPDKPVVELDKAPAPAAAAAAGLPVADSPDNREAANSSREVAAADTAGVFPEGHAICNNRNSIPTTSLRLAESKPIDSKRTTRCRHSQPVA
jgi:hypothetical protein